MSSQTYIYYSLTTYTLQCDWVRYQAWTDWTRLTSPQAWPRVTHATDPVAMAQMYSTPGCHKIQQLRVYQVFCTHPSAADCILQCCSRCTQQLRPVKKSGTCRAFIASYRVTICLSRNKSQFPLSHSLLWARPSKYLLCKYSVTQAKGFAKMNECNAWVILRNLALIRFWPFN